MICFCVFVHNDGGAIQYFFELLSQFCLNNPLIILVEFL
jgi:hypothetical protein